MANKKKMRQNTVKPGLSKKDMIKQLRRPKPPKKNVEYELPGIDKSKIDAFVSMVAADKTDLMKQDLDKRNTQAKYRYYTGSATPEDREFLTRTGVIEKPEAHDVWDLSDSETAMRRLNTGEYQGILGKKGEPVSDQQKKADSIALGLSPRARSYKPERVTAKDVFEDAKYRLALKVMNGTATKEEKKRYRQMTGKGKKNSGETYQERTKRYRDTVKEAQEVWNKERKERDEFGDVTAVSDFYNEPFREDSFNRMQASQDSLFWNDKAHIINQNEGTEFSPQDIEGMFYTGRDVAERIMQEYKDGTLQQRYPTFTPQGLKEQLQEIINQEVEKATGGMSLNNVKKMNDELEQQRLKQ